MGQSTALYSSGTAVRVKPGTPAPDYSDIPIGGWSGLICDVDHTEQPPDYLVAWNDNTLNHLPPIFRSRCERDDFDVKTMWLSEGQLEPDVGPPAVMEQPTNIASAPLNPDKIEDRVRIILGLSGNDPIPTTTEEMLRKYHGFLTANLSFPFKATYLQETEPMQHKECLIEVIGLLDPEELDWDEGLACEVREDREAGELPLSELEEIEGERNKQLIQDYSFWFTNWPDGPPAPESSEQLMRELAQIPLDKLPPELRQLRELLEQFPVDEKGFPQGLQPQMVPQMPSPRGLLLKSVVGFTLCGMVQGSLLMTRESALAVTISLGSIFGFIGLMLGIRAAKIFGALSPNPIVLGIMALMGIIIGAVTGATIGALAIALLGTLAGAIAGGLLARFLSYCGLKQVKIAVGLFAGAFGGAIAWAFYTDPDAALTGLLHGAWIGAATGFGLLLLLTTAIVVISRKPI
jgi:hypothetical protein